MKTILLVERLVEISKDTDPTAAIPEPIRQALIEEVLTGMVKPGTPELVRARFRVAVERELLPPGLTLVELFINGICNTLEQAKEMMKKLPSALLSLGQAMGETNAPACFRAGEVRGQVCLLLGIIDMCVGDLNELKMKGDCKCQPDVPEPTSKGGDA